MTLDQAIHAALELDRVYLAPVSLYARQSDGGINNPHLRWMVSHITVCGSEDKAMRWLGYIQGVLVAQGRATLDEMRQINKSASDVAITAGYCGGEK